MIQFNMPVDIKVKD